MMIHIITQETAHLYGDVIPSMYRLRYRAFIQRQAYNVHSIRKMEYDAYDTPATAYLVWRDSSGVVRGCSRISPTTRPYMIKDLWPNLVTGDLPCAPDIWEASRFCIERELPPAVRRQIHGELVYALQEVGLRQRMRAMVGVMQPRIWKFVFFKLGWPIEFLGPSIRSEGEEIVAGRMPISPDILNEIRTHRSLPSPTICNLEENMLGEAA